jgi:uncharacterized protein YyaL (SSP411 family)
LDPEAALEQLLADIDPEYGGFGSGPKFPQALKIYFLLHHSSESSQAAARNALEAILSGRLVDTQLGGFHRYTTDRAWQQPHFEKMLYDQAWMTITLLTAYQAMGDTRWRDAAVQTLDFVLNHMQTGTGLFASSYNAVNTDGDEPLLDEKAVTAWNGYLISALARAYSITSDQRYLQAALQAAAFLLKNAPSLTRLPAGHSAFAEDYAAMIRACLDLYEADFDTRWITHAQALQNMMDEQFADAAGGYFNTAAAGDGLIVRMQDDFDDAEPAANSMAAGNLQRLAALTGDTAYSKRAEQLFRRFAARHQITPAAMPLLLVEYMLSRGSQLQIVIAGSRDDETTQHMIRAARSVWLPGAVLLLADGQSGLPEYVRDMNPIDGQTTAYICEDFVCSLPVIELTDFEARLRASAAQSESESLP